MTDKEQILAELALLPLAKLQKLQNYANFIIIPDEDLLADVTMSQMYEKAMQLADTYYPEWTDRSQSDFGTFLVELFCLFSEKDFYYINAFGNESILRKAYSYSDIFTKSVELGYSPILCTAASVLYNVTFGPALVSTTYAPGALVIEIPTANLKFTNLEEFTVPATANPVTIPLTLKEGEFSTEVQVFNGYRIDIRKPRIDVESIYVTSNNLVWDRVRVFGQSAPTSRDFIVLPEEDGRISIYFGEDGYGLTPAIQDSFTISYLKCSGTGGNNALGSSLVTKQNPNRPVTGLVQVTSSAGGLNPETATSIKNNAINYFSTKFTVNNESAVERWLNAQPEVKRSKCIVQGNNVNFRVQPADGTIAAAGLLSALAARIDPFLTNGYNVAGYPTIYIDTAPLVLELYHLTGADVPAIIEQAKSLIEDYTNPMILAEYGRGILLTEIDFLLKSKIPLVQNVVFVSIAGNPASNVPIASYELLQKVPTSQITITAYAVS